MDKNDLRNLIMWNLDELTERINHAKKNADYPENLGRDVAYTNMLLARSNYLLALSNIKEVIN